MSQLRWILLGAGLALILGLWWWETRKARLRAAEASGAAWPRERAEPSLDDDAGMGEPPATVARVHAPAPTPPSAPPVIDRIRTPRRPPMIEIPEDFEVDVSAYVGKDRRNATDPDTISVPILDPGPAKPVAPVSDALDEDSTDEEQDDYHRAPWVRTHPIERSDLEETIVDEPIAVEAVDPVEERTAEASQQRIVALRLVATDGNWFGRALREELEAEGLNFGRYSIFHREREDGKALFYVASMMEPGSFDVENMDEQYFPGISLFGIVPGPLDGPATFDLILAVGRHLADRLKGQLQDEQGSTLTSQRVLNLREELVHFEHRNKRLRRT